MSTSDTPPGVRRMVAVVDLESYSTHLHPEQVDMQARLRTVLTAAIGRSGVRRRRVESQDRGDGRLLVLPAGVDEARVVPGLLGGLLQALDDDRRDRGEAPPLRMRMALGQGIVHVGATGYVGRVVVDACRLVDTAVLRAELTAVPGADLALGVADDVYRDVLVQGYGGFPVDGFRSVHVVRDKGYAAVAWLAALTVADLPDSLATAAAVSAVGLPLGAAPMLLEQTVSSWLGDVDADTGQESVTGTTGVATVDDATVDHDAVDPSTVDHTTVDDDGVDGDTSSADGLRTDLDEPGDGDLDQDEVRT